MDTLQDTLGQIRRVLTEAYPEKESEIQQMLSTVCTRALSRVHLSACSRCGQPAAHPQKPYRCCGKIMCAACQCDFGGRLYADGTTRCPGCFVVTDTLANILANIAQQCRSRTTRPRATANVINTNVNTNANVNVNANTA